MKHGINVNVVRRWIPLYCDQQAVALPAFIPLKVEPKRKTEALAIIELPFGWQILTVKWPTSDPEGGAQRERQYARYFHGQRHGGRCR